MKTIKKLGLVLSLAIATILSSCSKDSDGGSPTIAVPATGSYINASVNGANFTTVNFGVSSANAAVIGTGDSSIITVLGTSIGAISGTSAATSTISIVLEGVTAPGTYAVSDNGKVTLTYLFSPDSQSTNSTAYVTGDCPGTTGTVIITTLSATKVEGTFSFSAKKADTCDETKTVTSGSFRGMFM